MLGARYYELLGVGKDASTAEIKSAYRSRARALHPDFGGSPDAFHELRLAYETLSDPLRRAIYDRRLQPVLPARGRRRAQPREFGEDPDFTAEIPRLDPETLAWWEAAAKRQVHPATPAAPGHAPIAILVAWLLLVVLPFLASALLLTVWLLLATGVAIWLVRRHLALSRARQALAAEFGTEAVYGHPGTEPDQWAERLTADLLERYLTRLPNARIFHGLAWPGSVFADIDHAVLAGRRLVLIESKTWLPGHYATDETGVLWRNDRLFRGGATQLPEAIDAYRDLLPGVEIRGALIVYPSRAGLITTDPVDGDPAPQPMTPEQFVQEIGDWLAAESSTVDVDVLRTVRAQVV
ncbi:J domain-containing protein [Amycolatopsis taiwanensis]|uniref:Molecular chaperone DnaJ n=1 Tax=Amycolatopsis taiwanensis TaxID=342230 RepID=A0A9W6VF91_9PSEU|nr:DnaJ domain-containing protein [Amycolatopsis taiwanensis]GLY64614.1 molecular chaperone DnaJ [Amycolatopsis taiwanensis]